MERGRFGSAQWWSRAEVEKVTCCTCYLHMHVYTCTQVYVHVHAHVHMAPAAPCPGRGSTVSRVFGRVHSRRTRQQRPSVHGAEAGGEVNGLGEATFTGDGGGFTCAAGGRDGGGGMGGAKTPGGGGGEEGWAGGEGGSDGICELAVEARLKPRVARAVLTKSSRGIMGGGGEVGGELGEPGGGWRGGGGGVCGRL